MIYEDELDTEPLSRHIISSCTWQEIHFMNTRVRRRSIQFSSLLKMHCVCLCLCWHLQSLLSSLTGLRCFSNIWCCGTRHFISFYWCVSWYSWHIVTVVNINVYFWGVWWIIELKLMLMRSCDCSLQLSLSAHDGSGILRGQRVSLQHGGRWREDGWLWVRGETFSWRSPPLITADTPSVIMDPSRSEEPSRP